MNNFKNTLKASKGITLIALVITIIVLLILAGISISMLSGDNSILQKATEAKELTGIGQEKESISLAYNSVIIDKTSRGDTSAVTGAELNPVIKTYDTEASAEDYDNQIIVTFKNGHKYSIDSDGVINEYTPQVITYKAYVVGDYVEINGEGFYVIEDSPITQTTVKLLTAKLVNTLTKEQDDNANPVIFDNSTNVYANSSIKNEVESYANSLGVAIISSGLLSCEDMDNLSNQIHLVIEPDETGYKSYWLDSPGCDDGYAWYGSFVEWGASYDWNEINNTYNCWLRPVIEILKTNIPD